MRLRPSIYGKRSGRHFRRVVVSTSATTITVTTSIPMAATMSSSKKPMPNMVYPETMLSGGPVLQARDGHFLRVVVRTTTATTAPITITRAMAAMPSTSTLILDLLTGCGCRAGRGLNRVSERRSEPRASGQSVVRPRRDSHTSSSAVEDALGMPPRNLGFEPSTVTLPKSSTVISSKAGITRTAS